MHPVSSHSRWISAARPLSLTSILALLSILAMSTMRVSASGCTTSGPPSGAYTIMLCFDKPVDGTSVPQVSTVTVLPTVTGSDPGIRRLIFYLDGQYLLTDYESDFTFDLHSDRFVDGSHALAVEALMRDGFRSQQATITLRFSNGITQPPVNENIFRPSTGTTPLPGRPFVLAAAGDGASGEINAGKVTDLIGSWNPNLMLYLGDVYEKGSPTEFSNWYGTGNNFYSRFRPFTNPTIGNHEYENGQALGYFDYWDNIPNYYSYNAAGWHFISLNSVTETGQTAPASDQYHWLVQDLRANTAACTITYFHHPVYNVGPERDTPRMSAIWSLLVDHGVDLVLTGHDHDYQRWKPLDGTGAIDPVGTTQFVVGTGGHGIQNFIRSDDRLAKGFDTAPNAFGALRLELNKDGAGYQFINIQGQTLDSGSVGCSGAPSDTTAPSTPADLTATARSTTRADLSWTASTDNVGLAGYDIYRNGKLLTTTNAATTYTDVMLATNTTYTYQVRARDAAGNLSGLSNVAIVKTDTLLFSDGFESGDLSNWTSASGLVIQPLERFVGVYGARGTSTGAATYAYEDLTIAQNDLFYRMRFKILSQGVNTVYLQRFRTAAGSSLLGTFITSAGLLGYRNDLTGVSTSSTTAVSIGSWHELQTHVSINGSSSQTEVWLDSNRINALSQSQALGTTAVGRIQIGENAQGRAYDIAFDDVIVDTKFVALKDIGSPTITLTAPTANATVRGNVTLAANAFDDVAVDRVEFFINGTIVGADYLAPYSTAWNSTTRNDGSVAISARVTDTSTNAAYWSSTTVKVDNTAPDTTIDSGPAGPGNSSTSTFTFSANEPDASFDCSIDAGDFVECASPQSYSYLAEGSHFFQVVASDAAGNTDPTPASRSWSVVSSSRLRLPLILR